MLKLEVVTPQKKALETDVDSVTLPGSEGELGILPDHIPLLTTLDTGIVSYTNGSQKQILVVHWGYAQVEGQRSPSLRNSRNQCLKSISTVRKLQNLRPGISFQKLICPHRIGNLKKNAWTSTSSN
ncbi:MAG: ATP synthase F1 subunit epsilon [bacterium]